MTSSEHLHDRISRATNKLAQLQAQELVATQRKAQRERVNAQRAEMQRRKRVADLVFLSGNQDLDDAEIVAALRRYRASATSLHDRDVARSEGSAFLSNAALITALRDTSH